MKITKIEDGRYALVLVGGKRTERTITNKFEGQKFIQKTAISQSLNTDRFLFLTSVKEKEHIHRLNEKLLNERVGKYIKENNQIFEHQNNISIGWYLISNPLLQSREALEKSIDSLNRNHSQTKEFKDAVAKRQINKKT